MRRLHRVLTTALLSLLGLYVALCVFLSTQQRALLFPAPKELATPRGLERIDLPNGSFMLARLVPGDGPVVVHFHGNGEQVANLSWLGQAWAEQACAFVAVEYPGYPGTTGAPSEEALTTTAELALAHLVGPLKLERSRLVLFGQSLGTGVAVAMAAKGWGAKLVLLSPYTSLPDVGARAFPLVPVRWLMKDRFDSLSRAPQLEQPALVVHGRDDEVVPFVLGEQLARAIPGAKLVAREGRHHDDLWDDEVVQRAVFSFVAAP